MTKFRNSLMYLRNESKIQAVLGKKELSIMKESIQAVMNSEKDIEPEIIEGSKYDVIIIDDVTNTYSMIVFYIVKKDFCIYKLAFKEFV